MRYLNFPSHIAFFRNVLLFACFGLLLAGCTAEPVADEAVSTTASTEGFTPDAVEPSDSSSVQIQLSEPSQQDPVAVGIGLSRDLVANNEQVNLVIRAKIADGWHIYAAEGPIGVGIATTLALTLPEGITTAGDWSFPAKDVKPSSQGEVGSYHGIVDFSVPLAISAQAASGSTEIKCDFGYQACTDTQCQRPMKSSLSVPLQITTN